MKSVIALFAGLLLTTGCDVPDTGPNRTAAPPPPVAPVPPVPADPGDAPPPAGAAVAVLVDASGAQTATLSCGAEGLRIVVPGFRPIGSEDRLSIGAGGEAFALVADLAAPGPGVSASGAADPDLLDRLARGEALSAMYGQQSVGPLTAASPAGLQAVVSACRGRE